LGLATNVFKNVTDIRPECIYQVNDAELFFMEQYLDDIFSNHLLQFDDIIRGPFVHLAFYESGNVSLASIDARMKRMTHAMTIAQRVLNLPGDVNNTTGRHRVTGKTFRTDTCVIVRWPWLAFPTILAFATLVFFACMVTETRWGRHGETEVTRQNYKTELVPLLLHGLRLKEEQQQHGGGGGGYYEGIGTAKEKRKRAEGIYARFEDTETGWRLVETK
ncbi:hypothetical protein B0H63DRAFT_530094, partial [Podospora didyma]